MGCELYLRNKNYLKKQKELRFNQLPVMEPLKDVNIPKDQVDEIEGKDEKLGRGRQINLKQVFLGLEGHA